MKKFFALMLAAVMVFSLLATTALASSRTAIRTEEEEPEPIIAPPPPLGDVNCDYEVNMEDALLLMRMCMDINRMHDHDTWGFIASDMDYNGVLNFNDCLLLLRYINGVWTPNN